MPKDFVSGFTSFANSLDTPFVREGLLFYFPQSSLVITLVPVSDFFHMSGRAENELCSLNDELFSVRDKLYLYEDRWFSNQEIVKQRILARLGRFKSVFARKCSVVAVDGEICRDVKSGKICSQLSDMQIKDFIGRYHSYGYAKSKFRYALVYGQKIVAAAAFSASRPMPRNISLGGDGGNAIGEPLLFDSFEWVRYVSLPDVRVVGGMGRLLKTFLNDVSLRNKCTRPVEVMSYSDEEWSDGNVYRSLGFEEVAKREPVSYYVKRISYERLSARKLAALLSDGLTAETGGQLPLMEQLAHPDDALLCKMANMGYYPIKNRGSRKFLLQLP
ncbi:MAG: hypothetical protein IKY70_05125 [Bacteroidales bacterium]|nr:hypothetical protein [Bacteroidales bacterium]